jgi:DNA (cytosine-5)-methyltransferase 1
MTKLTAVDLFSGCGGLTRGLKLAGYRVVAAVEKDPFAVETYRLNHRRVHVFEDDIRTVTGPQILKAVGLKKGELDLLAGCPPCQGFSSVRRRNGGRRIIDDKNCLVGDFLRLVRSIRPRAVMLENVPWMLRTRHFALFRAGLCRMGYTAIAQIKDAQDYGVPQRRKRAILLALRQGQPQFAAPDLHRITVRDAIGKLSLPRLSHDSLHNRRQRRSNRIRQLIRSIPLNGGSRSDLPSEKQLKCHQKCDGFKDIYGRMSWGKVAPTITGGCFNPSKGRFLHPSQNRAITLREAAILQGFPNDYFFPPDASTHAIAVLIGNALPPEFVRRHALELRSVLKGEDESA